MWIIHISACTAQVFAFSHKLQPFPIGVAENLQSVMARARAITFGATDCSLPMVHARQHKLDVDAFVILTDSETCPLFSPATVSPRVIKMWHL